MIMSVEEAAHILIYMSRSKPGVERVDRLSVRVPRQKRGGRRRRSFPTASSSTEIVEDVRQEDASPTMPPLSRKKRPRLLSLFPIMTNRPKKKATRKTVAAGTSSSWTAEPTPEWLVKLMKGPEEPKRIIEKELKATDISRGHNRLSMPYSNIIDLNFLSPGEQRIIEEDEGKKHKTGIDAKLVVKLGESDVLKEFGVNLRRWRMPKKSGSHTFIYNLVTGWNKVVEGCGLDKNHKIRLWSFHSDGKLCFALALALAATPQTKKALL